MFPNSHRSTDHRSTAVPIGHGSARGEGRLRAVLSRIAFWRESPVVIHECRHCGATLESPESSCPYSGRSDVATYVIE